MKKIMCIVISFVSSGFLISGCTGKVPSEDVAMKVIEGSFEVKLTPQEDSNAPAGRMLINKDYSGALNGSGTGQMISKGTENRAAIYFAIEEFLGTVDGKSGGFTLVHKGVMNSEAQSLDVSVLEDSGTDDLVGISGAMTITQKNGDHAYSFEYKL